MKNLSSSKKNIILTILILPYQGFCQDRVSLDYIIDQGFNINLSKNIQENLRISADILIDEKSKNKDENTTHFKYDYQQINLAASFYPFNKYIYIKGGLAFVNSNQKVYITSNDTKGIKLNDVVYNPDSLSKAEYNYEYKTGIYTGLGLEYPLNQKISAIAEIGGVLAEKPNVNIIVDGNAKSTKDVLSNVAKEQKIRKNEKGYFLPQYKFGIAYKF